VSAVRQRWDALEPRERRVLALGAVVVLAVIGYLAVWEPLVQSRDEWRLRVAAAETDLAWMRGVAPEVLARRGTAPSATAPDGRSLLARVDASVREAGLGAALLRVEPVAANQVRVTFEQAGFDALMRWLESLAQRHGTRVTEMSVQRADGVGVVDARLGLEEPAP
jgi:general secretion pathway protein M